MVTRDHVVPRVKGGTRAATNLVDACPLCNNKKGDREQSEFMTWLASEEGANWLRERPPFRNLPMEERAAIPASAAKRSYEGYCKECGGRLPRPGHFARCTQWNSGADAFKYAVNGG